MGGHAVGEHAALRGLEGVRGLVIHFGRRAHLLDVPPQTPIVISTHIPFITVFTQILYGEYAPDHHGLVVENAREVLDLFEGHNLRIVLQGHLHYLEDIEVYGTHFITVGGVYVTSKEVRIESNSKE